MRIVATTSEAVGEVETVAGGFGEFVVRNAAGFCIDDAADVGVGVEAGGVLGEVAGVLAVAAAAVV